MNELNETIENPTQPSPMVAWFLRGDKYLHEDSLKNRNNILGYGALLYAGVFVVNEFVWHFTSQAGMSNLMLMITYPGVLFVPVFGFSIISRFILFGASDRRPNPAIGLPNRTETRIDYQNAIPPYGAKKWLMKRLSAHVELQCKFIMLVVVGWALAATISMPYFLLQK
jgi:hypothetical protein